MELEFESARSTVDLDLTVRRSVARRAGAGTVLRALRLAAERALEDFFEFRIGQPTMNLAGTPYGGARYPVDSLMDGRTFVKFHIDISVGDVLVDPLQYVRCTDWLAFAHVEPPIVTMTSREQQFAEKLHAYTLPRSTPNSRVRDLVDLVLLTRSNLDTGLVGFAIRATFERRGTHPLPGELPPPAKNWMTPFDALARQCNLTVDLDGAFALLARVLDQIGQGH
jgi:hypothetical protein